MEAVLQPMSNSHKGVRIYIANFISNYFFKAHLKYLLCIILNKLKSIPQENGDIYTGRILTCGSLIRSKILQKSSVDMQQKVLEHLVSAGKKRSYLTFVSCSFVIDFLNQLDKKSFSANVWPILEPELVKPLAEHNLDTLHLLLVTQDKYPSVVKKAYKKNFLGENIINDETLDNIVKILTVSLSNKI